MIKFFILISCLSIIISAIALIAVIIDERYFKALIDKNKGEFENYREAKAQTIATIVDCLRAQKGLIESKKLPSFIETNGEILNERIEVGASGKTYRRLVLAEFRGSYKEETLEEIKNRVKDKRKHRVRVSNFQPMPRIGYLEVDNNDNG